MFKIFYKSINRLFPFILLFYISGCEEALETSLADKQIHPIAPGQNVTTTSPVNFSWEYVSGASSYRLTVVSPSFDSIQILIYDSLIEKSIVSLPLDSGYYEWNIQALNNSSATEKSAARKLMIE